MAQVRYVPGEATAVVTGSGVALIAAELPAALVERIWAQLDGDRGLAVVLEALTGAFGTSLTAIPPFAVALAEGSSVRLAARGPMRITVDSASGSDTVSGAGVTTWSERVVDGVTAFRLLSGSQPVSALVLPVRDGVVLAAEVSVDRAGADAERNDAVGVDADSAGDAAGDSTVEPVDAAPTEETPATPRRVAAVPPPPQPAESSPAGVAPGLIDSAAVPWVTTGDTLLPNESTFAPGLTAHDDAAAPSSSIGGNPGSGGPEGADASSRPSISSDGEPETPWDATMLRPDDAPTPDRPPATSPSAGSPTAGDHDGLTVSLAEARAHRTGTTDSAPPPPAPPRPAAIGRLRLSTGPVVILDRAVVIGRRPRSTRVSGTDLPHLVVVDSPQQDISRSHVEVRTEGDSILVTDLHTTNGTTLLRAGVDPVRLHPGERTVVVAGDRIDLGDGVVVTVEDNP